MKLLIINVGGSSTKVALFEDTKLQIAETIRHDSKTLREFNSVWEQYEFRKKAIITFYISNSISLEEIDAFVSRGPAVKPLKSGVYHVSEEMVRDAESMKYGNHPCGLGCKLAFDLSGGSKPVLTVDPPCVDEMESISKYTGLPEIKRKSKFQALNHKAVAKRFAKSIGKRYDELNLVVCHLGSGISVASHRKGLVVDVTNGLDGDGPFGLDRVGTLPAGDWMEMCTSGNHSKEQLKSLLDGGGGMMAYLKTNNAIEIEKRIAEGDLEAEAIYHAMVFQTAKSIGAACVVFEARPDAILITGGLANSDLYTSLLRKKIDWICPIEVLPGEDELQALAEGAANITAAAKQ